MTARLTTKWLGKLVVDDGGRRHTILLPGTAVTVRAAEPVSSTPPSTTFVLFADDTQVFFADNSAVEFAA